MKKAEEFDAKSQLAINKNDRLYRNEVFLAIYKECQLDAMKEGMRRAAEICGKDAILLKRPEEWGFLSAKKKAILTAAEQLTEKDL